MVLKTRSWSLLTTFNSSSPNAAMAVVVEVLRCSPPRLPSRCARRCGAQGLLAFTSNQIPARWLGGLCFAGSVSRMREVNVVQAGCGGDVVVWSKLCCFALLP